jgi:site-specific DNA recombinase
MRAVIYARYSSDMQKAASIDDQLRLCKERIAREGWTLQQVYRDAAMSGASSLRPGYQAMLTCARNAECDVVVAEALDRLSRDQEDVAGLFKRLQYAGVRLVTLSEGEISELHVGLKGTMNALFLKDLVDKTRRGLRGRIEAGSSGGGLTYGYDVVASLDTRGERRINEAEAETVRKIFAAYRDGASPKRIALDLNKAGIAGPRGGAWSASTINGNRDRGTGILNNELYVGRLVGNRLRYSKDPESGRRRSRPNDASAIVTTEVPHLRIVGDDLWQAARDRQARLSHRENPTQEAAAGSTPGAFWSKQRPRYLFSGLIRCGLCRGGCSMISATHFGCSTARNKGPTACTNRLSVRRDHLENTVLDGLRERLMDPVLFEAFATEFTIEWNRLQASLAGDLTARQSELVRTKAQLEKLVDMLCNGAPVSAVKDRMQVLEERRIALEAELEAELENAVAPAPRLHPNLTVVYRQKVAALTEALAAEGGAGAMELVRGLIDEIRMIPEAGATRIEIRGELAGILSLAFGSNGKSPSLDAGALSVQVKMVAGIGNHRQSIPVRALC